MADTIVIHNDVDVNADEAAEEALREQLAEEKKEETLKRQRSEFVEEFEKAKPTQSASSGEKHCPECHKDYKPDLAPDALEKATDIQREQHQTGICSDPCWERFVGAGSGKGVTKRPKGDGDVFDDECAKTPVLNYNDRPEYTPVVQIRPRDDNDAMYPKFPAPTPEPNVAEDEVAPAEEPREDA